jgi:hypothetical protein
MDAASLAADAASATGQTSNSSGSAFMGVIGPKGKGRARRGLPSDLVAVRLFSLTRLPIANMTGNHAETTLAIVTWIIIPSFETSTTSRFKTAKLVDRQIW